jgi:hypothetical protein
VRGEYLQITRHLHPKPIAYSYLGIISIYQQVRLHIDRTSNKQSRHTIRTTPSLLPDLGTNQQTSQQLGGEEVHVLYSLSPYNDVTTLNEKSNTPRNTLEDFQSDTHPHNQDTLVHNGVVNMNLAASLPANTHQDIYTESLPFDNLNVQELWTWMGDLDGFDSQSL